MFHVVPSDVTRVRFLGNKLQLVYDVVPTSTGWDLKQLLQQVLDIQRSRLSLFILDDDDENDDEGEALPDDNPLTYFGLSLVSLRVEVDIRPGPIKVKLVSDQHPDWKKRVTCSETTTVSEFRGLVADILHWYDGDMGGMELKETVSGCTMEDGDSLSDYVVVDGRTVKVVFKDRLMTNGRPLDHPLEDDD
ncbi:hypothetical protein LINGRAHAP2_LOCUS16655 [Linum grandiflorum]